MGWGPNQTTDGLAPIIVEELLAILRWITREEGLSALVVEQHARKILGMTDRAIVLERGAIVHQGASADLVADPERLAGLLGVAAKAAVAI